MEPDLQILWEGNLNLDYVRWNKHKNLEFNLSKSSHKLIESHWEKHIDVFPDDYDGSLLFLNNFHLKDTNLLLDTSYMKFSTAIYMAKNKISVTKGIGVLGVQYLVFSPDKEYIIMGRRTLNESYYPGAFTIPGGMLELEDLNKSPKDAFMRELFEEVGVPFENDAYLTAMIAGWNGVSVAFLISTRLNKSYNFDLNENIKANQDEWEGNLKWFPISELKNLDKNKILDGLIYYRSKIK